MAIDSYGPFSSFGTTTAKHEEWRVMVESGIERRNSEEGLSRPDIDAITIVESERGAGMEPNFTFAPGCRKKLPKLVPL